MEEKWEGRDCGGNENTIGSGRNRVFSFRSIFRYLPVSFLFLRAQVSIYTYMRAVHTKIPIYRPHRQLKNGQLDFERLED